MLVDSAWAAALAGWLVLMQTFVSDHSYTLQMKHSSLQRVSDSSLPMRFNSSELLGHVLLYLLILCN